MSWEDSFYCPICGFRSDDLSEFRAEQEEEVEAGSGEEAPEQGMVITGGCEEVVEEQAYEALPEEQEEPEGFRYHRWVTLDDFIDQKSEGDEGSPTGEEAPRKEEAEVDAKPYLTSDDGHGEQATYEQGGSDQPYVTPERGMGLQAPQEQAVVDLLFKKKESEDMRKIRMTVEWWAKKHWFTVVDLTEMIGLFVKAIATVRTDRMPLYLFMLEELHFELREIGFSVLFIKPVGENLAEIWIGPRKEART